MDDDTPSGKAIIPEDRGRELSLPSEMIHRGLELAIRIERKQGLQPLRLSPITPAHKGHLLRSYLSFMEWYRTPDRTYKIREPEKGESHSPVYLWLSFDADGLHVACVSEVEQPGLGGMEGNAERYRHLNAFNDADPFTVPVSAFGLYYTLSHPMQPDGFPPDILSHLPPKEAWKNLTFRMCPTGQPGYQGPLTRAANPWFDSSNERVEIVVVYISMLRDADKNRELVSKNPPVKLSFTVIDPTGETNPAATRQLYGVMLDARNGISSAR
jgi:hypothetical protein